MTEPGETKRLGLIAGSGRLPFEVAEAARERGIELAIVAIEGNTDPKIETWADAAFRWVAAGELGKLIEFLKGAGAEEVILAGAVAKREMLRDPASLRPDARAIAVLSRLTERGDDAILTAVAGELESEGLRVVESTRHMGDRLTPEGPLGEAPPPDENVARDLELGMRVARGIGAHDVGQTVVVKDGTVLAVEAVEGTDAAMRRGAELGGRGTAVAKASKPHQDLRFDVPVIGPATVELAVELGVAAIGLEVGRTLVLERDRTLATARAAGLSVVGLSGAR